MTNYDESELTVVAEWIRQCRSKLENAQEIARKTNEKNFFNGARMCDNLVEANRLFQMILTYESENNGSINSKEMVMDAVTSELADDLYDSWDDLSTSSLFAPEVTDKEGKMSRMYRMGREMERKLSAVKRLEEQFQAFTEERVDDYNAP